MLPRGAFGCVACCAVMAMIMYALALASPAWSGYYIDETKCENKDGCSKDGFNSTYAKGKDVPKSWLNFQYHGVFLYSSGTTEAGMDYAKKHIYKTDAEKKAAEERCTKDKAKVLNNHCTWTEDSFACSCTYPSMDKWTEFLKDAFKNVPKDFCKLAKEAAKMQDKTYDDLQEDAQPLEMGKGVVGNAIITRITLITACCLHFIAMVLGYVGAVTVLPVLGIVAAVCNILGVALGITGMLTGIASGYYSFTFPYCGSLEWYKDTHTFITNPDDQLKMLSISGYFCIVGVAFSVFSVYGACFAAYSSKKAREQSRPDSAYNKF